MHVEPTGSCPPVQPATSKRCPACQQVKPSTYFATTPGGLSRYCRDCQRAVSRLVSRRRAAAMRLLIAAHPEEWAGLLGLVRAGPQVATGHPGEVAVVPEPSARRLLGSPGMDAPSARAASLASSAALRHTPGLPRSRDFDHPGIPPGQPPWHSPRPGWRGLPIPAHRCCCWSGPPRGSGAAAPSGALRAID
jgi:hypothetical protein